MHNYVFPSNACTNHQVVYHKIQEFDANLVQYEHIENDILYTKAIIIEKALLAV